MQLLVFLLVLANILFYAFSAGMFGHPDNPDANRAAQQVAPDKIRVVSRGEAPQGKASVASGADVVKPSEPEAEPEAAGSSVGAAAAAASGVPVAAPEPAPFCLYWERVPLADGNRLVAQIEARLKSVKVTRKVLPGDGGWWVHLPPQPNRPEADRRAEELKKAGISDYFIVQEAGPNRFAISLGIFSTEKAAQEQLAEVKGKGFKTVRLVQRPGKDSALQIEVRGPAVAREGLLTVAGRVAAERKPTECP